MCKCGLRPLKLLILLGVFLLPGFIDVVRSNRKMIKTHFNNESDYLLSSAARVLVAASRGRDGRKLS